MNVYLVKADYVNYRACVTTGGESVYYYLYQPIGKPFGDSWRELPYQFATQRKAEGFNANIKHGDFIGIEMGDIGLSPQLIRRVGDLFAPYGELLPLNIEGDTNKVFWFHCTNVIDALDLTKSKFSRISKPHDAIVDFQSYAFFSEKIQSSLLFQVSQSKTDLFCTEIFKKRIEDLKLTGLKFRLEWTDESAI
jgi:hypothetical protein